MAARTKLVNLRRDLDNQMRGLCKGLGIVLGRAGSTNLARKVSAVLADAPDLQDIFAPLLLAKSCLTEQIEKLDRQLVAVAKGDQTVRRMLTVPGIGPLTALSFVVTIDDPTRFRHSADVGAYLGLTKALSIRRDRSRWPHLQARKPPGSNLFVRGRECPADRCQTRFCAQALGQQAGQTHRRQKGEGCRRA